MMNNNDMMKKLVKMYGVDSVVELAKAMQEQINREEKSFQNIIPANKYQESIVKFPDWVGETVNKVVTDLNTRIVKRGSGVSCDLSVTNEAFAKYIVYTCNDDGKTLRTVLEILMSAPAWCKGRGMTRPRMELVFHIVVLHKADAVVEEMKKFLNKYDPVSLRVFAHADDAFRHVLNNETQMIAYTERYICKAIGSDEIKFNIAA